MTFELRPYQTTAVQGLRNAMRSGLKRIILSSPTGSGKTEMGFEIIRGAQAKGKKVAFLANRIHLVDQTCRRLREAGFEYGVIQGENTSAPWRSVLVCSVQSVASRGLPDVDLIVIDECFTGNTKIKTPGGEKDIDLMRCGDSVYTAHGIGLVESVFAKPTNETFLVEYDDGTSTECTGDHPIFTPFGWKATRELEVGTHTFSIEGVRLLWEAIQTLDQARWLREDRFCMLRNGMDHASVLLSVLCEEIQEPNEQPPIQDENEGETEGIEPQAYQAWRQRAIAALGPACTSSRARGRVGVGISNKDWSLPRSIRVPNMLQTGSGKPNLENWDRIGWLISYLNGETSPGHEEDRVSCLPRVVGLSRIEHPSIIPVFNLRISGHPSYFADGKLVHNCHACAGTAHYREIMAGKPCIGLTATPYSKGLGKHYSELGGALFEIVVTAARIEDLIRDGYLVSADIWAPGEPDLSKVKITAGDYNEKDLGEAVDKAELIGDIVAHWFKLANNTPTVCFATNIAHSKHIVSQFRDAGVVAEHIDCYTPDDERQAILGRVASRETMVISNVGILAEGWDFPACKTLILARPTKSLIRYLQMAGRVLRPFPGKDRALILDHSGVVRRLGFPWDYFGQHLDDGKPKPKSDACEQEKVALPKVCPQCKWLKPPKTPKCPFCGFEASRPNEIETADGELVPLTKTTKPKAQKIVQDMGREHIYGQLCQIAKDRGKSDKWINANYKEIFGTWPNRQEFHLETPAPELLSWIRYKQIQWAKSHGRTTA